MVVFISAGAFHLGHNVRKIFGSNAGLLLVKANHHTTEHANKEGEQGHAKGASRKLRRDAIEPTGKREAAIVPQKAEPCIHQKEERPDESTCKSARQHHARDKESAIRRLYQLCHVGPFSFTQDTLPGSNVNTRICLHMQCSNTSSQKQEWHIPKCDRHIKRYAKKALAYRRDTTCPARSPGRKRRLSQSENRDGPKPNSPNQSPRRLPQEARH